MRTEIIPIRSTKCKSHQQLAQQYLIAKRYIKLRCLQLGIDIAKADPDSELVKALDLSSNLSYHKDHYWICLIALRQVACKLG